MVPVGDIKKGVLSYPLHFSFLLNSCHGQIIYDNVLCSWATNNNGNLMSVMGQKLSVSIHEDQISVGVFLSLKYFSVSSNNLPIWCISLCSPQAFGNAKTAYNNNSSRFGKFIQVNYLESGIVRGWVNLCMPIFFTHQNTHSWTWWQMDFI